MLTNKTKKRIRHPQATASGEKRIDTLDVAKGIGIIFVVFAHVNFTPELLVLIYSFHMPLFFLLAGFVFRKEKHPTFGGFLVKRWKTLIIPYLLFSIIPLAAYFLLDVLFGISLGDENLYVESIIQIFIAQSSAKVLNTPLWFVLCLLAVEMMYFFISKLKRHYIILICIILAGLGWLLESGLIGTILLPWSLDSALFALSFYATGNLLAPFITKMINQIKAHKQKVLICIIILIGSLIIWYPLALCNGKISLGSKILNNGFLLYLTGVIGTVGVLSVSILLEKAKGLKYLGRNTFCIMSVHYLIKTLLDLVYGLLKIPMYSNWILKETILPFLIVLGLSILATVVYNALNKWIASFQKLSH